MYFMYYKLEEIRNDFNTLQFHQEADRLKLKDIEKVAESKQKHWNFDNLGHQSRVSLYIFLSRCWNIESNSWYVDKKSRINCFGSKK